MPGNPSNVLSDHNNTIQQGIPGETKDFVVFRELNKRNDEFYYSIQRKRATMSKLPAKFNTIEDILKNIDEFKKLNIGEVSKDEDVRLGIAVGGPSYVILSIGSTIPWDFHGNSDGQAISLGTLSQDDYIHNFSAVSHYNADGSITPTVGKNCRLVAFSVDPLTDPPPPTGSSNVQPINFHFIDAGGTKITVDPDIRYPGNTGPEIDPPPVVAVPVGEPQP